MSEIAVKPFCVFCLKGNVNLNLFTNITLDKCSEISKIYKDNNLCQKDVVLPTQPNGLQKYHAKCYRRFTAVPPKCRTVRPITTK